METYISFGKFTEQGAANIKEGPARLEAAKQAIEKAGGKMLGFYLTMGRYDFVSISQAPNADAVATILLVLGSQGNVRTETVRAFPEEEYKNIVANLP
jgi:uncharacterized protein with GYD domain